MPKKSTVLEIKGELDEKGSFEGLASVFGKVDLGGDTILPGAFKETLADMKKQGRVVPFLWRHFQEAILGGFTELKETKKGLEVKGQIIPELSDHANQAYQLMKSGLATGLSIGYRVPEGGSEYNETKRRRTIKKLDLYEISFVPIGMDPYAGVTGVKSIFDIRAKLAAGDQLSSREWEVFLKEEAGLTNSQAERAIRTNGLKIKGSGDPSKPVSKAEFLAELKKLIA